MANDKSVGRESDKFMLRFPEGMRDRIAEAAKVAGRSMNSEIVARLQATFDETVLTTVEARVRPGSEEKRFEFNADEIADKVVERLEERGKRKPPSRMVVVGDLGNSPDFRSRYEQYASTILSSGSVNRVILAQYEPTVIARSNEPYGPKKSGNAPKVVPKKKAR